MKTPKYPGLIPLLAQRCRDKATNWLLNLIIGGCARARGTFQISKQPTQARASPWKLPNALPSQKLKQRLRCKAKRRQCALNHLCESPHMRISALLFSALAGCGLAASAPVAGEDMTASPMDGAAAAINLLTFVTYAMDKSAAQSGRWRTSEKHLHLLSLAGGWPGAWCAQQWLRHKSSKQEFRAVY